MKKDEAEALVDIFEQACRDKTRDTTNGPTPYAARVAAIRTVLIDALSKKDE